MASLPYMSQTAQTAQMPSPPPAAMNPRLQFAQRLASQPGTWNAMRGKQMLATGARIAGTAAVPVLAVADFASGMASGEDAIRAGAGTAGSVAGAAAGTLLGGPVGTLIGGAVGGWLGDRADELVRGKDAGFSAKRRLQDADMEYQQAQQQGDNAGMLAAQIKGQKAQEEMMGRGSGMPSTLDETNASPFRFANDPSNPQNVFSGQYQQTRNNMIDDENRLMQQQVALGREKFGLESRANAQVNAAQGQRDLLQAYLDGKRTSASFIQNAYAGSRFF